MVTMDIFNHIFVNENTLCYNSSNKFKEWIDQIYYINLDSRPDRNKHIQKQLFNNGLAANRVSAIYGKKGHDAMLACKQSHKFVVEISQKLKFSTICILEDDVVFEANFLSVANACTQRIPNDWDILFLGHCFSKPYSQPISDMIYRPINIFCTHCYCVNKKAYNILIQYLSNPKYNHVPIDHIYNSLHQKNILNMYMCYPSIAKQIPNLSDIGQGPNNSNNFINND
jgi:GR25 family glycosyltransferase involved in LPS biosynthesis